MNNQQNKPNLVLIEKDIATLYINGKKDQTVRIDYSNGRRNVLASIEYFRQNGLKLAVI